MEDVEVVNVRVNPVHPIQNPSSIRMRQEGLLHRQTVVRTPQNRVNQEAPADASKGNAK